MGSENSTRWNGYYKRPTIEDCPAWDATDWARQEALRPGHSISGTWILPGSSQRISCWGTTGLLHYHADLRTIESAMVRVTYRATSNRFSVDTTIDLEVQPCTFGGWRFRFLCPLCDGGEPNRCSRLYLAPDHLEFGCRTCHRLVYRSSQQSRRPSRTQPTDVEEYEQTLIELREGHHNRELFRRMDRVLRGLGT